MASFSSTQGGEHRPSQALGLREEQLPELWERWAPVSPSPSPQQPFPSCPQLPLPEGPKEKQEANRFPFPERLFLTHWWPPRWVPGPRSLAAWLSAGAERAPASPPPTPAPPPPAPPAGPPRCGSPGWEQTPNLPNLSDVIVSPPTWAPGLLPPALPVLSFRPLGFLAAPHLPALSLQGPAQPEVALSPSACRSFFTPNERRRGPRSLES